MFHPCLADSFFILLIIFYLFIIYLLFLLHWVFGGCILPYSANIIAFIFEQFYSTFSWMLDNLTGCCMQNLIIVRLVDYLCIYLSAESVKMEDAGSPQEPIRSTRMSPFTFFC